MSENTLAAANRTVLGRKTAALRGAGSVPAVVYGAGLEPKNITIDRNQFIKTYKKAGGSSIIELSVEGESPLHVLIQDYQLDPVRDDVIHVDFRSIDMTKEIEATVSLEFAGESVAVKGLGGTLMKSRDSVTVRCLPSKLMRSFIVDLASLATFDDIFRISDLTVPEGVEILDDENLTIAVVAAPRTEAEMEALEEAVEEDVGAVEKEGEEPAEGEEAKEKEGEAAPAEEKKEEK